jgi:hypothetical protein
MKNYQCHCGNTVYFENTRCLVCDRSLGFLPDSMQMAAFALQADGAWQALAPASPGLYRQCANYARENVCNWMVPTYDNNIYCRACRLNHIIPDLSNPQNHVLWTRIERAKRRLLYTLYMLRLPVIGRDENAMSGLAFEFLAEQPGHAEFSDLTGAHNVQTGHRNGLITINIAEADPSARESMRERMSEQYRTLLGHFRHEIAHYYWDRLVRDTAWLEEFRTRFGDEHSNYEQALARYYTEGPRLDWQQHYISAYASSHPWEDFAETWAHYLHMVDTLETSHHFGFAIAGRVVRPPAAALSGDVQRAQGTFHPPATFEDLLADWSQLTLAMNALNRSMGLDDAYPFSLSAPAAEKLAFVHRLITASAG